MTKKKKIASNNSQQEEIKFMNYYSEDILNMKYLTV
jgi:hypothetical protein